MISSETGGRTVPALGVAGVAGVVVLSFAGAPQSLEMLFSVGLDDPELAGAQLAVGVTGAVVTAVAVLTCTYWRWLVAVGTVGVLVAYLFHVPEAEGWSVRVVSPAEAAEPPALEVPLAWACLVVAAAAVLLIGLLGLAQHLLRLHPAGAGLAGLIGCGGYYGVAVIGAARGADPAIRVAVVALATAVAVTAILRVTGASGSPPWTPEGRRVRVAAAVAALFSVLPTLWVTISGEAVRGTVLGGVIGLVVLAAGLAAAATTGVDRARAVLTIGLVLAAPPLLLFLVHPGVAGEVWFAWPIALAGTLLGVTVVRRPLATAGVAAAATLPMLALAFRVADLDQTAGQVAIWVSVFLVMATIAASVGSAAPAFAGSGALPALGALATTTAVGVHASLNFAWVSGRGTAHMANIVSENSLVVTTVLLALAAGLLAVPLSRNRSRTTTGTG